MLKTDLYSAIKSEDSEALTLNSNRNSQTSVHDEFTGFRLNTPVVRLPFWGVSSETKEGDQQMLLTCEICHYR